MSKLTSVVLSKVQSAINDYSMLDNAHRIVVGFSGGADSVCLLHCLNTLKGKLGFQLEAVHVNHGIRGGEAKRDEEFCVLFCKEHNIPFKTFSFDCVYEAQQNKESLEECGRRIRYQVFRNEADELTKIATAHNANDNAETLFFNLTRGASLKGACGIPPIRENIIRPLIYCSRSEIEGYCDENSLSYVVDSTNLQDEYARNKIRHNVIPVLEAINPSAVSNITSFCESAKYVYDFVSTEAENALERAFISENTYDLLYLKNLHCAVLSEAIVKAYALFSSNTLDRVKLDNVIRLIRFGGRCQLYGSECAEAVKGKLRFFHKSGDTLHAETIIKPNCDYCSGSYTVNISEFTDYSKNINKNVLDNLIDCDKIKGNLFLRTRRQGDEFTFYKRNITKSLKKLFNELGVPVEERDSIPVLCDDDGVVWIYSVGVCKRCHITDYSSNIICVKGENNG